MSRHLEVLNLPSGCQVLDVGCGCGEVLIRLVEHYHDVTGTGIDISPGHIEEANRRVASSIAESSIEFVVANAQSYQFSLNSVGLAICLGSTHSFGADAFAYHNALDRLISLVKPGGLLLLGEGYMRRPASPEYRKVLGQSMPNEMTHASNVEAATKRGLTPLGAWTCSEDEWDNFEWGYQRIVERQAEEDPDDSELAGKLSSRRKWMEAYLSWGRDTLGYGTYLFRKPAV